MAGIASVMPGDCGYCLPVSAAEVKTQLITELYGHWGVACRQLCS